MGGNISDSWGRKKVFGWTSCVSIVLVFCYFIDTMIPVSKGQEFWIEKRGTFELKTRDFVFKMTNFAGRSTPRLWNPRLRRTVFTIKNEDSSTKNEDSCVEK